MTISTEMDNVQYPYYWPADSSQAQNYSYQNSTVTFNPQAPPPQVPYTAPPPQNYENYNYTADSYYPPPSSTPATTYSSGSAGSTVNYTTYEYQSHTSYQDQSSYQTSSEYQVNRTASQNPAEYQVNGTKPQNSQEYYNNISYTQSNYSYNWNPNTSYKANAKTDDTQWIATKQSSWTKQSTSSENISSKVKSNLVDGRHKYKSNEKRRSNSPENRYRSSKLTVRKKYNEHSSRHRSRSRERRNSRDRTYKRRSRSFDRKSRLNNITYNNISYNNHKRERSRSRSKSRASSTRSRSRRRSRSQESHTSVQSIRSNNQLTKRKSLSEKEMLLEKYRRNFCATSDDIKKRLTELESESDKVIWTRTAPADLYYSRDDKNNKLIKGTKKLMELCDEFKKALIDRAAAARALQPPYEPPPRHTRTRICRHKSEICSSSSDSEDESDHEDRTMEELMAKKQHPQRLHSEMWFNDPGEMNDGPLCRCSAKSRRSGIRHGIYAGEGAIKRCDPYTNNGDKLYHYRITISPPTNFLTKTPTIIEHDEHEFIFEGFSMLSHFPLVKLPTCKVIRFNIEYTILYIEEKMPENFTIRELDLFHEYLFQEVLELVDFDLHAAQDKNGCGQFHFMPRFVRDLPDNGQEILSMNEVLSYLIKSSGLLINPEQLPKLIEMTRFDWQNFADEVKGMVVIFPGKKPCSVRVDQLDRTQADQPAGVIAFPEIVHFGIRPPQLSYAGNTEYQKAWRDYVKFRHLLANMPKPSFEDKRKLEAKENKLQELRTQSKMKRDVTVDVSSEGFRRTGIMCDIVQHAMLIPVLVCHLRFHKSLDILERTINYKFRNRYLLQLALTHPSYRENFGTNPDHARNSLTNCGIRQPEYGDRRIHYMNTRKRGINTLINIMSRFGAKKETESSIAHNERLEFLGDAVVEFLTSIHLFHMFPDLEEGGLATYRAAIVQNQHLAVLAKKLSLEQFMLYAHGSDLCHDLELRHAMANCFEALMGALFLDGGIRIADRIFGETLFREEPDLLNIWVNYPKHPLQEQEPTGDRQWIPSFELLQKLTKFEEAIGVDFTHIRLLARAFTDRSIGYTNLTLGSNQRLEFLGDTVLQLIVSEYLYKFFPEHHEGHLSLLRSSLVNNKTQAVVCDDLGMTQYAVYGNPKAELKTKDRADLLEAFLGALYVDKGLTFCQIFCNVCFFPRLQDFIMNQDWNDPKSKLQQCCLTLRTMDGGEPDIPVYKVIECKGPTNTRVYTVAVYFQGKRLAKASGHSIQEAEMNSAKEALEKSQDLFPQLDHQKRVIAKSMKMQNWSQTGGSRHRALQSSRLDDRNSDGGSDSGDQSRSKRRSRSRERDSRRRSRSRDRYDSVDRRRNEKQQSSHSSQILNQEQQEQNLSTSRSEKQKNLKTCSNLEDSTLSCQENGQLRNDDKEETNKENREENSNEDKEESSKGDKEEPSNEDGKAKGEDKEEAEDEDENVEDRGRKRHRTSSSSESEEISNDTNVIETEKKSDLPSEKKIKTKL